MTIIDKKLKAKITSFEVLGTYPKDYTVGLKVFTNKQHCELCGAALVYSFDLLHNSENPEKHIRIGADCVENFMEAHFPLVKRDILKKIKDAIGKQKSNDFLAKNPDIMNITKDLREYFFKNLRTLAHQEKFTSVFYNFSTSMFLKTVNSDIKSIERKKYLSEPKTKKIRKLHKMVMSGKFTKFLKEQNEVQGQTIADRIEKESEFYEMYIEKKTTGPVAYSALPTRESILGHRAMDIFTQQFYWKAYVNKKVEVIKGVY